MYTNGSSTKTHPVRNIINSLEKNSGFFNTNNFLQIEYEKCKREMYTFFQNVISEFNNYSSLFDDQSPIVTDLEIIGLKKEKLNNFITKFENKRISTPDPFAFILMLKNYIHTFDQF